MKYTSSLTALATAILPLCIDAQSTTCGPAPSGNIKPSVASGYKLQVVATGLAAPRGLALDSIGNLLVVEQGVGSISAHSFNESNGCLTQTNVQNVTGRNIGLNHGIAVSADGGTLYASSNGEVYAWDYNPDTFATSNQRTLVNNMSGSDHATRTLLLSEKVPGMLIVSRGSTSNLDIQAAQLSSGLSEVKAFNISNQGNQVYDYAGNGTRLGWGLRNDVGVAEHPNSGGIYSVENSADQITRMGVDVHENNPGEELNFLGYLNGTETANEGRNFGYPWCFAVWDVAALPNNTDLRVGTQFAISETSDLDNMNRTDSYCAQQVAPRLTFQAHMAPLDIKFNNSGTQAWITFHGSWDRDIPVGYKLSLVNFTSSGEPTDPANSTTAAVDVISNQNITSCPGSCFRPVAMAIDRQGRIFMSSDASGEIYLISRDTASSGTSSAAPTASGAPTSSGAGTSATANAAPTSRPLLSFCGYGIAICLVLLLVI